MLKILVTGGAGYIGSTLVPTLLKYNFHVTVLDNFMYRQPSLSHLMRSDSLDIIYGDVRDKSLLKMLLKKVDIVIPLAAIVGAPACNKDEILASSINKDSTLELLKLVSRDQVIIMPTTNSAYGVGDRDKFCDENSDLKPISSYARDKVIVENALMNHSRATSFRLATVFGISPRMRLDLLVNNFVYRALTDRYLVVYEGSFMRNYIHVLDVAEAFLLAISKPESFQGEIFNVGLSNANISKLDLCAKIKEAIPDFVFFEAQHAKDPDQRNYIVSNEKVEKLGFAPKVSLEDGIHELTKGLPMFQTFPYTNL